MPLKISIDGNLSQEPHFAYTSNGTPVLNLTVASNERVHRNNEWVDSEPTFHSVTLWGKQAEALYEAKLAKGAAVHVEANKIDAQQFTRADGTTGINVVLTATKVTERTFTRQNSPEPDRTTDRAAARAALTGPVTIHHTDVATGVSGISRQDRAVHKVLRENGFSWAGDIQMWMLPATQDAGARGQGAHRTLAALHTLGVTAEISDHPPVQPPAPPTPAPPQLAAAGSRQAGRSL